MSPRSIPPLLLLESPYSALRPMEGGKEQLKAEGRKPGSALIWVLDGGATESDRNIVEQRPGGLALIVILPQVADLANDPTILHLIEACRPHGILPFHERLAERELAQVLKRPPDDLSASVTDYLAWRGIRIDRDTVHLIRRTIDKSADLRSISSLARSMYVSRRALGRRFSSRGLPVPSHWLHLGRLLRVAIKLQNSRDSIFSVAYEFGYPDGFSVSNQMARIVGVRPHEARKQLGWEWLMEGWLRREAESGGLAPDHSRVSGIESRPGGAKKPRRRGRRGVGIKGGQAGGAEGGRAADDKRGRTAG